MFMQNFETREYFISHFPNVSFLKSNFSCIFEFIDFSLQISSIRELHYNTEGLLSVIKIGSMILNYVGYANGSQKSDLVECSIFFLLTHLGQLDRLDGIIFIVC